MKAPLIEARETVRIPLFSRVEVRGRVELGTCFTSNISRGGLYLKAPDAQVEDVPVGSSWWVRLKLLSGAPVELTGEAVWVDPAVRDHQGKRSLAFGLRFSAGQDRALSEVSRFVAAFRYRAVALGVDERVLGPLADCFRVERVGSEKALVEALGTGQVDLLVHGDGGTEDGGAARLARILKAHEVDVQPPALCCAAQATDALERVISASNRAVFVPLPAPTLALRSLAERLVEAQALAMEVDALTRELRQTMARLEDENRTLRLHVPPPRLPGLVGDSAPMRRVYEWVDRVAPVNTTVLLLGESGTGKERIARAVHAKSARADKPFVAQNCAALSESLLDGELFGHVRGAFTGAVKDRAGLFESAEGGTVFLDEVGEMSAAMQAKLLRVIQEREVRRLGSTKDIPVDVRVLCATHRDLASMVKAGAFREDLYYRLRAFVITLPPLRERRSDIAALAAHFLEVFAERHQRRPSGYAPEAVAVLEGHSWPGNVRELELTVERLVVLSEADQPIDAERVREALRESGPPEAQAASSAFSTLEEELEEHERQRIQAELVRAGGVVAKAARALGMDRTTLSKRCKRLGLPTRLEAEGGG